MPDIALYAVVGVATIAVFLVVAAIVVIWPMTALADWFDRAAPKRMKRAWEGTKTVVQWVFVALLLVLLVMMVGISVVQWWRGGAP